MKFGIWISAADPPRFITAAARARDLGFDGIALSDFRDPALPAVAHQPPVACINICGNFSAEVVVRGLAIAKALASPLVRVPVGMPGQRLTPSSLNAIAQSLLPLAAAAAAQGTRLVIQNSIPELPLVRDLWMLIDRCQHPAVACSWDITLAARAGEGPSVGVPVLNSRLALVQVRTSKHEFERGDRAVEELIHRLRGIGYAGYLMIAAPDPSLLPDDALQQLLAKLRKWHQPPTAARKHAAATHATPTPVEKKAPAKPAGAV